LKNSTKAGSALWAQPNLKVEMNPRIDLYVSLACTFLRECDGTYEMYNVEKYIICT